MLTKLIILEIFILVNAGFDAWKIKEKWILRHGIEGLVQLLFITGLALIFDWSLRGALLIPLFLAIFWAQFDVILNIIRKKSWWHLGGNVIDQFMKGYFMRYDRLIVKANLVALFYVILIIFS